MESIDAETELRPILMKLLTKGDVALSKVFGATEVASSLGMQRGDFMVLLATAAYVLRELAYYAEEPAQNVLKERVGLENAALLAVRSTICDT